MNIKLILAIIILIFKFSIMNSQIHDPNEKFHFAIEFGGGISYKVTPDVNSKFSYNNTGFTGILRIKWIPDKKLNIGLETGIIKLFSIETGEIITSNNGKTSEQINQTAIPFILDFSMKFNNFEAIAGIGYYYLNIRSNARDPEYSISSSDLAMGYLIGINYNFKLSDDFSISPELKYYLITEMQHNAIALQIHCRYNIYDW